VACADLHIDKEKRMHFGASFLIQALDEHDRANGRDVMTVLIVRHDDPVDTDAVRLRAGCRTSGLPHGQKADWRIPVGDGRGLHGYVYDDRIEFHLDAVDACRDAVGHILRDTKALEGAALGALAAGSIALLAGGKGGAVASAVAAGAIGGGVAGAYTPARTKKVIEFRDLIAQRRVYGWSA
jgi:hypothetical protein